MDREQLGPGQMAVSMAWSDEEAAGMHGRAYLKVRAVWKRRLGVSFFSHK